MFLKFYYVKCFNFSIKINHYTTNNRYLLTTPMRMSYNCSIFEKNRLHTSRLLNMSRLRIGLTDDIIFYLIDGRLKLRTSRNKLVKTLWKYPILLYYTLYYTNRKQRKVDILSSISVLGIDVILLVEQYYS